ncbi:MAG: nucleotidyltransferase family protein [Rhodoblastus sp.]|nr:nucleotidyltransferase family protein [Rhodoblastus sp.]MCO5087443.1 nucleotidyltransferase family protein [Methylobacteriaceae bacterium]
MVEVAAIVLAAGRSTRFSGGVDGATKLVAEIDGAPLVRHAVVAAIGSGARPVIVVTGHAREAVMAALAGLDVQEARNPRYADGIASSVSAGVAALPARCEAALVFLGDMPRVTVFLARRLIEAFDADPALDAVAPLVKGRRGNPVLLSRGLFAQALTLEGDEGARKLLMRPDLRVAEIAVDDCGAALDIDTPETLRRLTDEH